MLLPGDPGRALALAQLLLEAPRMFNHHRGLWGYTGAAADGEPLTIQATGMGGPSAAIVLEELCDLGVTSAIRVGTCGSLSGDHALGELIVVGSVLATDGTSRALGAEGRIEAHPGLTRALSDHVGRDPALVASGDVFYERDPTRAAGWVADGAVAVEMEAAALLQVGRLRGVAVGCVLAVSDLLGPGGRTRIDAEALATAAEHLGQAGAAGLGVPARESAPARGLVDPELEEQKARRERDRTTAAADATS
ncbi:purine-nucleoside phosphorylase [Paraconexibacter sp.]|uniref:phosphorylase family protein n=1 Tax=Paraconexibacter sp. TaxID=2949640 RepID=UPI0035675539